MNSFRKTLLILTIVMTALSTYASEDIFTVDGVRYKARDVNECYIEGVEDIPDSIVFHSFVTHDSRTYEVIIDNNIKDIPFRDLDNVIAIDFREISNKVIPDGDPDNTPSFYNCPKLERVYGFPETLKTLRGFTFYNCENLDMNGLPEWLPSSIVTVEGHSFILDETKRGGKLTIPSNWVNLEWGTFGCYEFEQVTVPYSPIPLNRLYVTTDILYIDRMLEEESYVYPIEFYNLEHPTNIEIRNNFDNQLRVVVAHHLTTEHLYIETNTEEGVDAHKVDLSGSEINTLSFRIAEGGQLVSLPSKVNTLTCSFSPSSTVNFTSCLVGDKVSISDYPDKKLDLNFMSFEDRDMQGNDDIWDMPWIQIAYGPIEELIFPETFKGIAEYDFLKNLNTAYIGPKTAALTILNHYGSNHELVFGGSLEEFCNMMVWDFAPDEFKYPLTRDDRGALEKVTSLWYGHGNERMVSLTDLNTTGISNIMPMIFSGYKGLKSVTIAPETQVDYAAFFKCTGLEEVNVYCPRLAPSTFLYDFGIKKVTFGKNLRLLEGNVFSNGAENYNATLFYEGTPSEYLKIECKPFITDYFYFNASMPAKSGGLYFNGKIAENIELTEPIDTMPSTHFSNVLSLKTFSFYGRYPRVFSTGCFQGCTNLQKIDLKSASRSGSDEDGIIVESYAFNQDRQLTDIGFLGNITKVGYMAFNDTGWLNAQADGTIYIGQTLVTYKGEMPGNTIIDVLPGTLELADRSLQSQSNLTGINLPEGLLRVCNDALAFTGLTGTLTIPSTVTDFQTTIYSDKLTTLIVADGDTPIESMQHPNCENLTEVYMGREYTPTISWNGAGSSNLLIPCNTIKTLTFGPKINELPAYTFSYECSELTTLRSLNPQPPTLGTRDVWVYDPDTFEYVEVALTALDNIDVTKCVLEVPADAIDAYRNAEGWNKFLNIIGITTGINDIEADTEAVAPIRGYYNITGEFSTSPFRGFNIEVRSDGSSRKLIID